MTDERDQEEIAPAGEGERERRSALRIAAWLIASAFGLLIVVAVGLWLYTGTASFADLVRERVERNLEAKLGRDVTIGRVVIERGRTTRVILEEITIANVPGATREYFAVVPRLIITGGVESFRTRTLDVGVIEVERPSLWFEVFPEGSEISHNFPSWATSEPRRFEIVRVELDKMFIRDASFEMLDRRRDLEVRVAGLDSELTASMSEQIYEGLAAADQVMVQLPDAKPIVATLHGRYRYEPGALSLEKIALRGDGITALVDGRLDPITLPAYDLEITSRVDLAMIRETFDVEQTLEGEMQFRGTLAGKEGEFTLAGNFDVPALDADPYQLAEVSGSLEATGESLRVAIDRARYAGGTVTGDYALSTYEQPRPMSVELRYDGVSLEGLFADWGLEGTGLRGAATGSLRYAWEGTELLDGAGSGSARLSPGAVAFGDAPYPIAVGGSAQFAIERGIVRLRPANVSTGASDVTIRGSLALDDLRSDLEIGVASRDFGELDRIAVNFAQATGTPDFELLGLGGSGTIEGTVGGTLKSPRVAARIDGKAIAWNGTVLGDGGLSLRYDGATERLTLEDGVFALAGGSARIAGTIAFAGDEPRFDLTVVVDGYPVERALAVVDLDLDVRGTGTGRLVVGGTPENGTVTFDDVRIVEDGSTIRLNGLVAWLPGEGNVRFDLDVGVDDVPVERIAAFFEMATVPVTGRVTGTLHIEGPKEGLEGAGSVILRQGSIAGEPIDAATADLIFEEGVMRASHVEVRMPGGVVTGEAEFDIANERFSYLLQSADLDVAKVGVLAPLARFMNGRLRLTSSGVGSFDQPELVFEATIEDASIPGVELPPGAEPPQIYLAVRDGRLLLRGSLFDAVRIEGSGTVSTEGAIDGTVQVVVSDAARLAQIVAGESDVPLSGSMLIDLRLGGTMESIETLAIEGTIPEMSLQIAGRPVEPLDPIRFALDDGRFAFESFRLRTETSTFVVDGGVALTGDKAIDLSLRGEVQLALLQIFMPELRTQGSLDVTAAIGGTIAEPRFDGTAEVRDAQLRLPGFPQLIHDITGTVIFKPNRIELDALQARIGGGLVSAGGFLTLDGTELRRVRVNLQGSDVVLRYFEGLTVEGDFGLLLSGDLERMLLQGDVSVERGVYYRDFDLATSVLNLLLERKALQPEVAAGWQDRVALNIDVTAIDTLQVKNNIADITGSANLDLVGTLANPNVIGRVEIDEGGKIRFQDVNYQVVQGTINFQNPFRIDPFFDITAEGRLNEYDLTINLTGTLDRITPTISSDPPISDLTLLSLLAGDVGTERIASGTTTNPSLSSAGASLLVQSLGGLLGSKVFSFADTFRLEQPGVGIDSLSSFAPRVRFEKQISDDIRVIVIYSTLNQHNAEIIEWRVNDDWTLQFIRDTERDEYAIDARFRRRYEGRW